MKIKLNHLSMMIIGLIYLTVSGQASAANRIIGNVRIIHASSGPTHMDPALRDLGHELQSVFKYTAYRLVNTKPLNLKFHQEGHISLPGSRFLTIFPMGFNRGRIKFRINILKQKASEFRTEIMLRNGSSITIGGPVYRKGYLLFNISATAR